MSVYQKRKFSIKNPIKGISIFDAFFLGIGTVDIVLIAQAITVSLL